jgi:hypothetical protein
MSQRCAPGRLAGAIRGNDAIVGTDAIRGTDRETTARPHPSGMVTHMARMRTPTRPAPLAAAITAAAVLGAVLAGCGDGSGGYGGGSASPSPTKTTAPSTPSPSASPSGTAKTNAERQVRANWEQFFSPDTPISQKAGLLENGEQLQPLLQQFSGDPRVGQVQAKVKSVDVTSATEANVKYSLSLKGTPVLPDASGTSVLQDKVWKVSDESLCALVRLNHGASAVPGC